MKTRNSGSAGRERLALLRRQIARIEGRPAERLEPGGPARVAVPLVAAVVPADTGPSAVLTLVRDNAAAPASDRADDRLIRSGLEAFDVALGGGLARAALTELRTGETRHAASLCGFALGLMSRATTDHAPLLWISSSEATGEAGLPYLPALAALFHVRPGHLFEAVAPHADDVLWVAEQAAASGAFSGILVELRGNPKLLGLDETRRLQRRAVATSTPVFLMRLAGAAQPTAAPCRLLVEPAPAGLRHTLAGPLEGSLGSAAFTVTIEKARAPSTLPFVLEWNHHDRTFAAPHSGAHAAASFNRPARPPALGAGLAQARAS